MTVVENSWGIDPSRVIGEFLVVSEGQGPLRAVWWTFISYSWFEERKLTLNENLTNLFVGEIWHIFHLV